MILVLTACFELLHVRQQNRSIATSLAPLGHSIFMQSIGVVKLLT